MLLYLFMFMTAFGFTYPPTSICTTEAQNGTGYYSVPVDSQTRCRLEYNHEFWVDPAFSADEYEGIVKGIAAVANKIAWQPNNVLRRAPGGGLWFRPRVHHTLPGGGYVLGHTSVIQSGPGSNTFCTPLWPTGQMPYPTCLGDVDHSYTGALAVMSMSYTSFFYGAVYFNYETQPASHWSHKTVSDSVGTYWPEDTFPAMTRSSLQAVMTHEIMHGMGFNHNTTHALDGAPFDSMLHTNAGLVGDFSQTVDSTQQKTASRITERDWQAIRHWYGLAANIDNVYFANNWYQSGPRLSVVAADDPVTGTPRVGWHPSALWTTAVTAQATESPHTPGWGWIEREDWPEVLQIISLNALGGINIDLEITLEASICQGQYTSEVIDLPTQSLTVFSNGAADQLDIGPLLGQARTIDDTCGDNTITQCTPYKLHVKIPKGITTDQFSPLPDGEYLNENEMVFPREFEWCFPLPE